MGRICERHFVPANENVRVVAFGFSEFCDRIHKLNRLVEIMEYEISVDACGVRRYEPFRRILKIYVGGLRIERIDVPFAWDTVFFAQFSL